MFNTLNATQPTIIDHLTTAIPPPSDGNAPKPCNICHRQVSGPDRQNHMGRHILHKLRGVTELGENIGTVSTQYPCGFCGQTSIGGNCLLNIKGGKAASKCVHSYDFMIGPASKISKQKPCTNVPIACKFCNGVHWKYNMRRHLRDSHPSWERNATPKDVKEFSDTISITNEEETRLGIPDEYQGRSNVTMDVPHDAAHRPIYAIPRVHNGRGDSPQRHERRMDWHPPPLHVPDFVPDFRAPFPSEYYSHDIQSNSS